MLTSLSETAMEPLSTFFRISPTLLIHDVTTPRSQSSSSFSSPSFADHQTGLKVYRESPASLNSAHQVILSTHYVLRTWR